MGDKQLISLLRLSTGYEIPVYLETAQKDIKNLISGIIEEILIPNGDKFGPASAEEAINQELIELITELEEGPKSPLLHAALLELIHDNVENMLDQWTGKDRESN